MEVNKVPLRCICGTVTGSAKADPNVGNRVVCYCNSGRNFALHLDQGSTVLDESGGTDIYQMPLSNISFDQGADQIKCIHITQGGMYRWYAGCCNTLIGNTGTPKLPFIGLIHSIIDGAGNRQVNIGPVRLYANTGEATKPVPEDRKSSMALFILRFITQMLYWKLTNQDKPNPFFNSNNEPITKPQQF